MITKDTSVDIQYKQVDGWHIFRSNNLQGLCVANKDLQTALNDVYPSIEQLVLLDSGTDYKQMSFEF